MNAREMIRDTLTAQGERAACTVFRQAYEAKRRPELIPGSEPAPPGAIDLLWASRQALIKLDAHTRMWEMGREIDCDLFHERSGN